MKTFTVLLIAFLSACQAVPPPFALTVQTGCNGQISQTIVGLIEGGGFKEQDR